MWQISGADIDASNIYQSIHVSSGASLNSRQIIGPLIEGDWVFGAEECADHDRHFFVPSISPEVDGEDGRLSRFEAPRGRSQRWFLLRQPHCQNGRIEVPRSADHQRRNLPPLRHPVNRKVGFLQEFRDLAHSEHSVNRFQREQDVVHCRRFGSCVASGISGADGKLCSRRRGWNATGRGCVPHERPSI